MSQSRPAELLKLVQTAAAEAATHPLLIPEGVRVGIAAIAELLTLLMARAMQSHALGAYLWGVGADLAMAAPAHVRAELRDTLHTLLAANDAEGPFFDDEGTRQARELHAMLAATLDNPPPAAMIDQAAAPGDQAEGETGNSEAAGQVTTDTPAA